MMDPIHEEEREGCKLAIYPDDDPMNPITDYEHAGTIYSWARDFSGDESVDNPLDYLDAVLDAESALREYFDAAVVVPLRFSDYGASGATLHICDADDANACWAVTAEELASEWFPSDPSKGGPGAGEQGARRYCETLVDEIDAWLRGETWGFVVTTPTLGETESCWGFIDPNVWSGDPEKSYCVAEARAALDRAVEANRRELAERDRLAGFVETVQ